MRAEVLIKRNIPWTELELLQQELIQKAKEAPDKVFLLVSEPQATFTFGRQSNHQDLLWEPAELRAKGVEIAPVSRGGKWTFHGPGQIVIYPIGALSSWKIPQKGARIFVETLRQAISDTCKSWNIPTLLSNEPFGLFVGKQKLASFGLSFEHGISSHGAAIYWSAQDSLLTGIRPCGMENPEFTFLQKFRPNLSWDDAAHQFIESIKKGFKIS